MIDEQISHSSVEAYIAFKQPLLQVTETDEHVQVQGVYVVGDGPSAFGPIAKFNILCFFAKAFFSAEPIVIETEGQIPRIGDRHMYRNGVCCICIWEEWLAVGRDLSFRGYFDGPLSNFFLSQIVYEQSGTWPFDERSHGLDGIVEAVGSILGFPVDLDEAKEYMRVLSASQIKGHWSCPCGSKLRTRDCHLDTLRSLAGEVAPDKAKLVLNRLKSIEKAENAAKKT